MISQKYFRKNINHKVFSSYVLQGENGGCITTGPNEHILLGKKNECVEALEYLKSKTTNVKEKNVFPRLTDVVL